MAKWPYNTRRWRQLRLEKLRDQPLCEYCPPHLPTPATEVDHRQAINNGGDPWAWENLASTCGTCHKSKTDADKRGKPWRRKGFDENGMPLDQGHAWNEKSLRADAYRPMRGLFTELVSGDGDGTPGTRGEA